MAALQNAGRGLLVCLCSALLAGCVSLSGLNPARDDATAAHEIQSLADRHLARGNATTAVSGYRQVLQRAPRRVGAWRGLALGYQSLGETRAAEQAFARALALDKTEYSRHALARFRIMQQQDDAARRLLRQVLSDVDYPERTQALQDRAGLALLAGNWALARTCWQHVQTREPGHGSAAWHLQQLEHLAGEEALHQAADTGCQ